MGRKKQDEDFSNSRKGKRDSKDLACTYKYPKGGAQCGYQRMPNKTRCSEHPIDLFPDELTAKAEDITLSTLEEIRDFQQRILNEIYRDVIDPSKGKAIAEILRHQISVLEKIWERSPEARQASLEQIQKVLIMARGMDAKGALDLLMEQDFKGVLEYQSQFVDVEVENGQRELEAASEALLLGNFPGLTAAPDYPGMSEAGGAASVFGGAVSENSQAASGSEEDIF